MAKKPMAAARSKSGGSFLLGLFVGLLAGLAIALGVAFYVSKTPIPFLGRPKADPAKDAVQAAKPPAIAGMPQGAPPVKAPEKPKFDFYRILPGSEEAVTERELKDAARAAAKGKAEEQGTYFIQAGSFQNPADADNQKARLAILGLDSSVDPTTLPDKGTWYRVRMGPFTRLEDVNKVRQTLAQNGIDASLVRVKDAAKN
jgi:cell division protein FtsN